MSKYSDSTKNRLCDIYRWVNNHKNGEFTVDNIKRAPSLNGISDKFANKFIAELDSIKELESKQPFKYIKFINEQEDPITNKMVEYKSEIRNYFDWDLKEMEYSISLTSRHYKRIEIINTNIN
jgi:hypothetical protein